MIFDMKFFSWRRIAIVTFLSMIVVGCQQPTKTRTGASDTNDPNDMANDVVDSGDMGGVEKDRPDIRDGIEYGLFEDIHFDYDSAVVRSADRPVLENIAKEAKEKPGMKIRIEGNCDERGTLEYNRALGQRRALSAREYLVKLGVAADRLSTVSFGEERPEDPGHNDAAWAKNRRDVFGVVK